LAAAPLALPKYVATQLPDLSEWCGLRAALLAHMLAISRQMSDVGIPYMFGTYTMCSWHLTVLHLALTLVPLPACHQVAQLLLFPMVFSSLITLVIWWGVVVPMAFVWSCPEQRRLGVKYFTSNWPAAWGMFNVHGFNAVFAVFEGWLTWRQLTLFDLWVGLVYSVSYGMFYILVLDPKGLHYYIVMSPRPHWCGFTYVGVVAGVVGMFGLLRDL